jgi:small nuclear ribonucleoprotein D2
MPPVDQPTALEAGAVAGLTVAQLRRELAAREAPTSGRKAELQKRLLDLLGVKLEQEARDEDSSVAPGATQGEAGRATNLGDATTTSSAQQQEQQQQKLAQTLDPAALSPSPIQSSADPQSTTTTQRRKRRWAEPASAPPAAPQKRRPLDAHDTHLDQAAATPAASELSAAAEASTSYQTLIAATTPATTQSIPNSSESAASALKPAVHAANGSPRTPFTLLDRCITDRVPCLVSCRHNKKLYGTLRAYDKHFNLIMEHVREIWQESQPDRPPDLRERFISRLFVRGDGVIFIVRPRVSATSTARAQP